MNLRREAVGLLEFLGTRLEAGLPKVRAAECAAECVMDFHDFPKAIGFLEYALRELNALRPLKNVDDAAKPGERAPFTPAQARMDRRLRRALAHARQRLDESLYGEGYVAYRHAQSVRERGAWSEALLRYEELVTEHPDTVYAEAAKCYRIPCLLQLATEEGEKSHRDEIEKARARVDETKERLKNAKKQKVGKVAVRQLDNQLATASQLLKRLLDIETGPRALQDAAAGVEAAIRENVHGLYRGEMMLTLGRFWLEERLDASKGRAWLERAEPWFSDVQKVDADLAAFDVPDRARKVSAPPPTERVRDRFGNRVTVNPKSDQVFNRRTSPWYLTRMHREAVLLLGLVAYAENDMAKARGYWDRLPEVDPYFAEAGPGTVHGRLQWNLENNEGALYATSGEMKSFKRSRRRLAVYLGDLAYENEDPAKARRFYETVLEDPKEKLSKNERAYLTYAAFASRCWDDKGGQATKYMQDRMDAVLGTPSEGRARLALAAQLCSSHTTEERKKGWEMARKLARSKKHGKYAEKAKIIVEWMEGEGR